MILETMNKRQLKALVIVLQHSLAEIDDYVQFHILNEQETGRLTNVPHWAKMVFKACRLVEKKDDND